MKKLFVFDVLFVLLMAGGIAFEEDVKLGFSDKLVEKWTAVSDSFLGIFESEKKDTDQKSKVLERNFQLSENEERKIHEAPVFEPLKLEAPELNFSNENKLGLVVRITSTEASVNSTIEGAVMELANTTQMNQRNLELLKDNSQELLIENDLPEKIQCKIQDLQEVIHMSTS